MCVVKLEKISIENFKNVKHGIINTKATFDTIDEASIIGIYGQNGSGKTAFVDAMKILFLLMRGAELPRRSEHLIYNDEEKARLEFEFLLTMDDIRYKIIYVIELGIDTNSDHKYYSAVSEELKYKREGLKIRYKNLISQEKEEISIRTKKVKQLGIDQQVELRVIAGVLYKSGLSFIFNEKVMETTSRYLSDEEASIYHSFVYTFSNYFHIIDSLQNGLVLGSLGLALNFNIEDDRGSMPVPMTDTLLISLEKEKMLSKIIEQINEVLPTIIPNLTIEVKKKNYETLENGEEGVRVEVLSNKAKVQLPIRCESAGALKLISILSTLIAVYNNPNACVVIDELDSGIFEYLLGEVLHILESNGSGQLFFTSHNLRVLEVLNHRNLWFTTTNEEQRYIQLKGVKEKSNARDRYLRAVQLDGEEQTLYNKTKSFQMKRAFLRAGKIDD